MRDVHGGMAVWVNVLQASCLETSSACQARESCRRISAAVGAPRRELPRGHPKDTGQPLDLLGTESSLPTRTVAFGSAYGGGGGPTHQLAELGLCPPLTQAKCPDVRAYDGELLGRDLIDAAAPSGCHVLDCRMTL
jgi:hypothetical protein